MRADAGVCMRWALGMRVAAGENLPLQMALSTSQQRARHLADPLEDESTMRPKLGWQKTPRKALGDLRDNDEGAVGESGQASWPLERLFFEKRHVSTTSTGVAKCACDSERQIKGIAVLIDTLEAMRPEERLPIAHG